MELSYCIVATTVITLSLYFGMWEHRIQIRDADLYNYVELYDYT